MNTRTSRIKTNVLFDVTFRYALLALNKLKQLKQEADDWAAKVGRLVGVPGNDDGGKTEDPPTPGVVSNDLGYYCCLDDESLVFICKKLNVDVKEMLVLNRRHITELTSHAKLIEGTCLDLPEDVVLPKAINDERLRASQAKLPLTSLKELHKLKHHDVVSKVNMEQLMVTLHSTIQQIEAWCVDESVLF